jgi:hypothetical protein
MGNASSPAAAAAACGCAHPSPSCPANCSGAGACGADGVCVCDFGRGGAACEDVLVALYYPPGACPRNCSGRGACTPLNRSAEACVCDAGWAGADCGLLLAGAGSGLCQSNCSGRCAGHVGWCGGCARRIVENGEIMGDWGGERDVSVHSSSFVD